MHPVSVSAQETPRASKPGKLYRLEIEFGQDGGAVVRHHMRDAKGPTYDGDMAPYVLTSKAALLKHIEDHCPDGDET